MQFESLVNSKGSQTDDVDVLFADLFESLVNSKGSQTMICNEEGKI